MSVTDRFASFRQPEIKKSEIDPKETTITTTESTSAQTTNTAEVMAQSKQETVIQFVKPDLNVQNNKLNMLWDAVSMHVDVRHKGMIIQHWRNILF